MAIIIDDKKKCCGCSACFNVCVQKCIEMKKDEQGFVYPIVNKTICSDCNHCINVCPIINKKTSKNDCDYGYVAYNLDNKVRSKSSSGGISYSLAKYILSVGGVVYGVSFDEYCKKAIYIRIDNINDLVKIQGSKYVQSYIENSFQNVKKDLLIGKKVLFTGTPCQIEGLYASLGKDYDNLITQDIICYGVNSPTVWNNYILKLEKKYKSKCIKTLHRDKSTGWKKYSISLHFENGRTLSESSLNNVFIRGFLMNMYLRPSCYSCSFKDRNRKADITIADCWGIEKLEPSLDDDKGLSFVWIHSLKGYDLIKKINNSCFFKEIDVDECLQYNPAALVSANHFERNEWFWKKYNGNNMSWLVKKMLFSKKYLR